jgi:arsenate reductase
LVEAMREVGIDISGSKPKALTIDMVEKADRVITMGCSAEAVCPATFVETEDWAIEDPKDKPVEKLREIRDEIKSRVTRLLAELR